MHLINVKTVTTSKKIQIGFKISGKFLKDGGRILAIIELFDLSMVLTSFPNACQIAKLKPSFKKGSQINPSIYRPISPLLLSSATNTSLEE